MFNKTDDPEGAVGATPASSPAASKSAAGKAEQSHISTGLKVVGNLESDGDVVIGGTVEGDITSRGLTVSQGARVQGSIQVETVEILGTVQGQVRARTVRIARTGEMTGDVHYEALSIDEGAMLDGQCRRLQSGRGSGDAKVSKLTAVDGGGNSKAAADSGGGKAAADGGGAGSKKEEPKPVGAGSSKVV